MTVLDGRQASLFRPESTWLPPTSLPDLTRMDVVSIDTETCDPNLKEKGAGWSRGDSRIVGVSVAWPEEGKAKALYAPYGHEGGDNLPPENVIAWLNHFFKNFKGTLIGMNFMYDAGNFLNAGIDMTRVMNEEIKLWDVMFTEALLDENRRSYSLASLAETYSFQGKDEGLLKEAAFSFGVDPKSGLWRIPSRFVGSYAEHDAVLPLRIYYRQRKLIEEQRLEKVHGLEHSLVPCLLDMRMRGVRVDLDKAERYKADFLEKYNEALQGIKHECGLVPEVFAADSVARCFQQASITYPKTGTGRASFTDDWLSEHPSKLAKLVTFARKQHRAANTFCDGMVLSKQHNGRIHPEFHPLRSDEGGTVTGRLCLAGETPIMMPGQTKLIKDMQVGDLVYCYDADRKLTIGKVKWAGITGIKPVYRIKWKDGHRSGIVVATGNHPFRLHDGTYRACEDLKKGDSLIALSRKEYLDRPKHYPTIRVFKNSSGKSTAEHRAIWTILNGEYAEHVHHKDGDIKNNLPSNLEGLTRGQHLKEHQTPMEASRRAYLAHARFGDKIVRAAIVSRKKWSQALVDEDKLLAAWEQHKDAKVFRLRLMSEELGVSASIIKSRLADLGLGGYKSRRKALKRPELFNNHAVSEVEKLPGVMEVYDLEVEEHHNFIANEICVHNSCSNPNIQQCPTHDIDVGNKIRELFLPEEGEQWAASDWKQQEPRLTIHFAEAVGCTKASEAAEAYRSDHQTDNHNMTATMIFGPNFTKDQRKKAKTITLGRSYSMGGAKLCHELGLPTVMKTGYNGRQYEAAGPEGEALMKQYDAAVPYIRELSDYYQKMANETGVLRTLSGRLYRFCWWEPRSGGRALKYEDAVRAYGANNIKRAYTHKALNSKIQGSGADVVKISMRNLYRAGHKLLITMHDENGLSVGSTARAKEAAEIMNSCVKLRIPMLCDIDIGKSWGEAKPLTEDDE